MCFILVRLSSTFVFFGEEMQVIVLPIFSYCTNIVDFNHQKVHRMHHFGASPITTVFFVDKGDGILPRFTSFTIMVNFKAGLLQTCMGCHQQYGDHHKVHGKGFILMRVLSQ